MSLDERLNNYNTINLNILIANQNQIIFNPCFMEIAFKIIKVTELFAI